MSVRDGISADLWDAASAVASRVPEEGALYSENYIRPLALALQAERDRCARIAGLRMHSDTGYAIHWEITHPGDTYSP